MPTTKKAAAPAALGECDAKRDFRATPEPAPSASEPHRKPIFVIREHHATRLHYDFRLEADGVLKSWAVTNDPSLDPAVKRLAVRVEDHPVAYATFSGTIPAGHYWAGEVFLRDHGTFENLADQSSAEGLDAGKLSFTLHGTKLTGRFSLVQVRPPPYLKPRPANHPGQRFVLFDLDPGLAPFTRVVTVARRLHSVLKGDGIGAFLKTSGKTGLHVFVPWADAGGFNVARAWALTVAERVAADLPDAATTDVRKAKWGGRVYIDVLQNARGHHAVPPYVLRSVPGATVSTPLRWTELTADLDPKRFTLRTVPGRLARLKTDPMAQLLNQES